MLIIVPTRLEMRRLFPELGEPPPFRSAVRWMATPRSIEVVDVAWCGFGLAAAGAGAAALLAGRSDSACLVGLAGTFDCSRAPVGSAFVANRVHVAGLGLPAVAGAGDHDVVRGELEADASLAPPPDPWMPQELEGLVRAGALLSVAVPSRDLPEASARLAAHPDCLAEDMEAHAVLHAAGALGRRLTVLRGISNEAGDREKAHWRIEEAAAALRSVIDPWLAGRRA